MAKVAIIGLGIMGRRMLAHMQLHPAFSPEWLWDPSPQACRAALEQAPEATVTQSAEDAIADEATTDTLIRQLLMELKAPKNPKKSKRK